MAIKNIFLMTGFIYEKTRQQKIYYALSLAKPISYGAEIDRGWLNFVGDTQATADSVFLALLIILDDDRYATEGWKRVYCSDECMNYFQVVQVFSAPLHLMNRSGRRSSRIHAAEVDITLK